MNPENIIQSLIHLFVAHFVVVAKCKAHASSTLDFRPFCSTLLSSDLWERYSNSRNEKWGHCFLGHNIDYRRKYTLHKSDWYLPT